MDMNGFPIMSVVPDNRNDDNHEQDDAANYENRTLFLFRLHDFVSIRLALQLVLQIGLFLGFILCSRLLHFWRPQNGVSLVNG
jgi:hypothetical protein